MKWSTRYTVRELYGANRYPNSRGTEGAGARGNCADAYPATEAKKKRDALPGGTAVAGTEYTQTSRGNAVRHPLGCRI